MEYLPLCVYLVLAYTFMSNRDKFEKSIGFLIGMAFATLIGTVLGGHAVLSQIACVALCQFAWTLFHSVQVGLKRFRNTLIVVTVIVVLISLPLVFKISSPPAYLGLVVFLLIARWLASIDRTKSGAANAESGRERLSGGRLFGTFNLHRWILYLDRSVESSHRWAQYQLWPWVNKSSKLKIVCFFLISILFLTLWHDSGGLRNVDEGSVALVRNGQGDYQRVLIGPGTHAVWPFFQTLVPISLHGRVPESSNVYKLSNLSSGQDDQLLLRAQTSDGFNFSVKLTVNYRLSPDVDFLVALYQGGGRGNLRAVLEQTMQEALKVKLSNGSVSAVLPPLYSRDDFDLSLKDLANQILNRSSSREKLSVESVSILREWRDPLLQVPIDGLTGARQAVDQFGQNLSTFVCTDNPNCKK